MRKLGVHYPVGLDNDYGTWNAYANQYWPAEYLIDRNGHVRHVHFGEGDYGGTEMAIRTLLAEPGKQLGRMASVPDTTPRDPATPESYLGAERLDRFASPGGVVPNVKTVYRFPSSLPQNDLAYAGEWTVRPQKIVAGRAARLRLHFHARHVYLVLGGTGDLARPRERQAREGGARARLQPALHAALVPADARRPARAPLHAGARGLRLHVRLSRRCGSAVDEAKARRSTGSRLTRPMGAHHHGNTEREVRRDVDHRHADPARIRIRVVALLALAAAAAIAASAMGAAQRSSDAGDPCGLHLLPPRFGEPAFRIPPGGGARVEPLEGGALACLIHRADGTRFARAYRDTDGQVIEIEFYRESGALLEDEDAAVAASGARRSSRRRSAAGAPTTLRSAPSTGGSRSPGGSAAPSPVSLRTRP